jgi:hypothetical protein
MDKPCNQGLSAVNSQHREGVGPACFPSKGTGLPSTVTQSVGVLGQIEQL